VPVGLTPVTIKMMTNYTLEISDPADHPRYVSTLGLCVAMPIMLCSPLVGLVLSYTSFELVFLAGACLIALAGVLTCRLREPRHDARVPAAEIGVTVDDA
jgi:hypothetical protein